jgi:hypothetical protein
LKQFALVVRRLVEGVEPLLVEMDVACRAIAGAAAFSDDPRQVVVYRRVHQGGPLGDIENRFRTVA